MLNLFKPKAGNHVDRNKLITLSKGHDIKLVGAADSNKMLSTQATHFAIKPRNYRGMSPIPRVEFKVGDHVKAGNQLMFDKKRPEVKYCAPVSGELVEVRRGAKRAITNIIIKADKDISFHENSVLDLANTDRQSIVDYLLNTGGWAHLNQRPFDIVPDSTIIPRDIFISTFDSSPNAADSNVIVEGNEAAFQKGIDTLTKLTDGKVYLGLDGRVGHSSHEAFKNAKDVVTNWFVGKHPSGNVGVQIHHTSPINSGDLVWTLGVQDVIIIGRLMMTGMYDTRTKIALTGAGIENGYVSTFIGASVSELIKPNITGDHIRIVSGNVLTGTALAEDDFLDQKTQQISILEEGDKHELFGWLLPRKTRPSVSPTFLSHMLSNFEYDVDTNTHGEGRAFVVTGQYEKVLPMDIYPMHLLKAVLAEDIENMEGLGILELSEEDFALCEFICPSKTPMQAMLRQGLDLMREQL